MHPHEEAVFEKKAEQHFKGHRGLQDGRDFRWNVERFRTDVNNDEFDRRFDETFPGAPGSPEWWENKFNGRSN